MPDTKKDISRKSRLYFLLKYYVDFCFRKYYRITYHGKEQTPTTGKLIFAPNHQNALMDALAVLSSFDWQCVFLARSDAFANKTVTKILTFLKILPVYRIRDGFDQVLNNNDVFHQVFEVLDHETPITIMPEGNHDDRKLLRNMKKGIARLAFGYRHGDPDNLKDIRIVPVGLTYFNHHERGSHLHIRYGQPLAISEFDNVFSESPPKAHKLFLDKLYGELKELVLHIEDLTVYESVSNIADMYAALNLGKGIHHEKVYRGQKQIIATMEELHKKEPETFQSIEDKTNSTISILKSEGITAHDLRHLYTKKPGIAVFGSFLFLILASPLYLYTFIQNFIPRLLVSRIGSLLKEPQFISTAAFVTTIFLFPICHLLQSLLVYLITGSSFITLLYATLLLPGFVFENYFQAVYTRLRITKRFNRIKNEFNQLISELTMLS
jgi:1-acyl-sn-glycerol-3-phosphate acyltransferase